MFLYIWAAHRQPCSSNRKCGFFQHFEAVQMEAAFEGDPRHRSCSTAAESWAYRWTYHIEEIPTCSTLASLPSARCQSAFIIADRSGTLFPSMVLEGHIVLLKDLLALSVSAHIIPSSVVPFLCSNPTDYSSLCKNLQKKSSDV